MTNFGKKTLWLLGMLLAQQLVMFTAAWAADPAVKPQNSLSELMEKCSVELNTAKELSMSDQPKSCMEIIEKYPNVEDGYALASVYFMNRKKLYDCIALSTSAILKFPNYSGGYTTRGLCYLLKTTEQSEWPTDKTLAAHFIIDNFVSAVKDSRRAISLSPNGRLEQNLVRLVSEGAKQLEIPESVISARLIELEQQEETATKLAAERVEERRQQELTKLAAEREERRQREILALREEERKRQEIARAEEVRRQQEAAAKLAAEREAARVAVENARQKELENAKVAAELSRLREQLSRNQVQAQAPVQNAHRKALVIGNDRYNSVTPLKNAGADAKLLAERLNSVGFTVTLKTDLTQREMLNALRIFKSQVNPGDEVAVFFAGHGVQIGAASYLLPTDVSATTEEQIKDESIPLQRVLDDMSERKAKLTLALIDACRDNPFKSSGRSVGGARGLAPTSAATGQMVVYSAGAGQQALDKLGESDKVPNGLFTRVFADQMQKAGITVDQVVRSVRNEVARLARTVGHEQVPAIYDQVEGEFYLKR